VTLNIPNNCAVRHGTSALRCRPKAPKFVLSPPNSPNLWTAWF